MPDFYSRERKRFNLFYETHWRPPQLGALTAALSHWTLKPKEPALVSIPTGAGKTAIAMATPYVIQKPREEYWLLLLQLIFERNYQINLFPNTI